MIQNPKYLERTIFQMYVKEQMTRQEIANELGVSRRSIDNYIKKWGLFKSEHKEILKSIVAR